MSAPTRTEASDAPEAIRAEGADHDECLARLRALVEANKVERARRMVTDLASRWPDSPRVQYWARVLAPPKVLPSDAGPTPSLEKNHQWLRDHRTEYPGCWIAVADGELIAADPDIDRVRRAAREALGSRGAVLFQQPADE